MTCYNARDEDKVFIDCFKNMIKACHHADSSVIIYPFPKLYNGKNVSKNINPISNKNLASIGKAAPITSVKMIGNFCNKSPWIRSDNKESVIIIIGHNSSFDEMCYNEEFQDKIEK